MSAQYAFGIVRPPGESMPPDSPIYRSLGILRFCSARTCSRTIVASCKHIKRADIGLGFECWMHVPVLSKVAAALRAAAVFVRRGSGRLLRPAPPTAKTEHAATGSVPASTLHFRCKNNRDEM
jgi:hypothetical protein